MRPRPNRARVLPWAVALLASGSAAAGSNGWARKAAPAPVAVHAGLVTSEEELKKCLFYELAPYHPEWRVKLLPTLHRARLRSQPIAASHEQMAARLAALHLPGWKTDEGKVCFVNELVPLPGGSVIDRATGLEWAPGVSVTNRDRADASVAEVNARRYLDHDDWRLPTAEEALSIARSVWNCDRQPSLGDCSPESMREQPNRKEFWIADRPEAPDTEWGYYLSQVDRPHVQRGLGEPHYVRVVRGVEDPPAAKPAAARRDHGQ